MSVISGLKLATGAADVKAVALGVLILASYTTHGVQHLPGTGHSALFRQLQFLILLAVGEARSFLLCECMICATLLEQL